MKRVEDVFMIILFLIFEGIGRLIGMNEEVFGPKENDDG